MLTILLTALAILLDTGGASGETSELKFRYNIDYKYIFHNREFMYSKDAYTASGTFNGMMLLPMGGVDFSTGKFNHSFRVGYEFMYSYGSRNFKELPQEPIAYYKLSKSSENDEMSLTAGLFPRKYASEDYSEAVWSDSLKLYDRYIEGVLLNYKSESFKAELGCDWMEQYGDNHRERFQIFTTGRMSLLDVPSDDFSKNFNLSLCWQDSYIHYANYYCTPGQIETPGVADNNILLAYLQAEYCSEAGFLRKMSISAGPVVGYHWERRQQEKASAPVGFESVAILKTKELHVKNTLYIGPSQQPLYKYKDLDGNKYGNNLYLGQPFYAGFFDKIETLWNKQLGEYFTIGVGADLYFTKDGFAGWVQTFKLVFNLNNSK